MAQTFRQRIAQAEAMARADMLRFQPEVLNFIILHKILNSLMLKLKNILMKSSIRISILIIMKFLCQCNHSFA